MKQSIHSAVAALSILLALISSLTGETPTRPTMAEFMGLNGHTILFKPELYSAVGRLVRDYHPVEWDLADDSSTLPAWPEAKNHANWEHVYGSWRKKGYNIDVCLMFESLARNKWKDIPADSKAYGRSFAREFGPSGSRRLVDSVEIGNEPGKWSDADYHIILENMGRGVRQGDPELKILTCALTTGPSGSYAKSVECLSDLNACYDILNIHSYAQLENWPTWRRSYPEDPCLKNHLQDIQSLCEWRDLHAKGKPVWITEFGYDSTTSPQEKTGDFKQWVGCTDTQQAQWLVRSYLLFSSLPVGRAYLYFFNDENKASLHSSSGLTRNFTPKPSFYAVSQLYRILGDYRFSRMVRNESGLIRIQEYQHKTSTKKRVWVAWLQSGENKESELELVNLPGRLLRFEEMIVAKSGAESSAASTLPAPEKPTKVTIRESPLYLILEVN